MSENNKSYRVRTNLREDKFINVNLNQNFNELDILSLKINTDNFYKLHTSDYGCLVGRVIGNGGVGIPNAKLSVFIPLDSEDAKSSLFQFLYPYTNVKDKDEKGIRYNLLPDKTNDICHQDVGTFPNKRMVLDDGNVIEIFDKYYKFTTVTNAAGDYMIFGLPTGNNLIHSELDLSDIGILSQKPRDFYYKGYNKTQFENSNKFKSDTNLDYLTQIISQDDSVYVFPFWGDDEAEKISDGDEQKQIKITRSDIDINYKFEPTCIFIGSIVADDKSNGFSKKCIPTERSGKMDRLTTGAGTIEMIRKTLDNQIESFSIEGNNLIDGNGTWCYQIPMNLDYMKTDEFGNFVPAENELTGIPTRARVRFRISLADYESDSEQAHLPKILVPNNPNITTLKDKDVDYYFGTNTRDDSFCDLMWNNVYTVKQYIPRIQKSSSELARAFFIDRNRNFSGIKAVNVNGSNNPIPYNNIRIQFTFLFVFQCILFKALMIIVRFINWLIYIATKFESCSNVKLNNGNYVTLDGSMCPTMEGWYVVPGAYKTPGDESAQKLVATTLYNTCDMLASGFTTDTKSSDLKYRTPDVSGETNGVSGGEILKTKKKLLVNNQSDDPEEILYKQYYITAREEYFVKCVELQFAMEYEVIQFDFYNDWLNGCLYFPRWMAELKRFKRIDKVAACNENFTGTRQMVQQCALKYHVKDIKDASSDLKYYAGQMYIIDNGCGENKNKKCHKRYGRASVNIMNGYKRYGGIIRSIKNVYDDKYVYYLRPSELIEQVGNNLPNLFNDKLVKLNLFATDIVLLGSVTNCNRYGIPTAVGYPSSSFIMPPPTGQLLTDSQDIEMSASTDTDYQTTGYYKVKKAASGDTEGLKISERYIIDEFVLGVKPDYSDTFSFQTINKKITNFDEGQEIEMSGIDWGYNPFSTGTTDDTTLIKNQVAGHFLEIGCTYSMTNQKSCINLQRICELGSEAAQSHFKRDKFGSNFMPTSGVVSTNEVVGADMRVKFASLNSRGLETDIDEETGYLKYDFVGYAPYSFDGSMNNVPDNVGGTSDFLKNLQEYSSQGYLGFRFNKIYNRATDYSNKFLMVETAGLSPQTRTIRNGRMPVYENSFYFYFGLKDGNTAIDRLYGDYFSECPKPMAINEILNDEVINYVSIYNPSLSGALRVNVTKSNDKYNIFEYLKDDGDWTEITNSSTTITITPDSYLYLRGQVKNDINYDNNTNGDKLLNIKINKGSGHIYKPAILSGALSSLWNYKGDLEYLPPYCGYDTFADSYIGDISDLVIPSSKLSEGCFKEMFSGCTELTSISALNAINIPKKAYSGMFKNCTSLTNILAPMTIQLVDSGSCYAMFSGCTNLDKVNIALVAPNLGKSCYESMFEGCTNLTGMLTLFAVDTNERCCYAMFSGCGKLTNINFDFSNVSEAKKDCYTSMFADCTLLTIAPELPATTLGENCYNTMFWNCASLETAPKLPTTALTNACYANMFAGCTSLTTAPELPATALTNLCYYKMFDGCSSLSKIVVYFKEWKSFDETSCTDNWVNGVFGSGIFICPPDLLIDYSVSNIPSGWAIGNTEVYGKTSNLRFNTTNSTVTFKFDKISSKQKIWYATQLYDGKINDWKRIDADSQIIIPSFVTVYLIGELTGDNSTGTTEEETGYTHITFSSSVNFSGNLNYLWNGLKDESELNTLEYNYCGYKLFSGTSITTAPELPATVLTTGCYDSMFYGCTSLTTAPELPATALTDKCYYYMFNGCSSLSKIVVYFKEWQGTGILSKTNNWVRNVSENGTFVCPSDLPIEYGDSKIPNGWTIENPEVYDKTSNLIIDGGESHNQITLNFDKISNNQKIWYKKDNILSPWIRVTENTEIPINEMIFLIGELTGDNSTDNYTHIKVTGNTIGFKCYFNGNLNYLWNGLKDESELNTLEYNYCGYKLFSGCTSLETAPELLAPNLTTGCYESMFSGCTSLNKVTCLLNGNAITRNNFEASCTNWLAGVAEYGGIYVSKDTSRNWDNVKSRYLPSRWIIQELL